MSDPLTDAAIADRWPERWAQANAPTRRNRSKARQQLRKRYAQTLAHEAFVEANPGARCASCDHCRRRALSAGLMCLLDSDFYGDRIVNADDVCTRFSPSPENPHDQDR